MLTCVYYLKMSSLLLRTYFPYWRENKYNKQLSFNLKMFTIENLFNPNIKTEADLKAQQMLQAELYNRSPETIISTDNLVYKKLELFWSAPPILIDDIFSYWKNLIKNKIFKY